MNTDASREVPDLILEQFRLGELPADQSARLARLMREDARLRQRVEALDRSDREIASRYPSDRFVSCVRQPDRAQADSRRFGNGAIRGLVLASAIGTGAAALAFALPWTAMRPPEVEERLKGTVPALAVYRRTPAGSETLADGAAARAGDLLRIGYVAAGRTYGVILSIDGRGVVTMHLPHGGGKAAPLTPSGTTLLDDAFELDDAPAWERFYFVTADHPFDVAPILEAARRAAQADTRKAPDVLALPRDFGQSMFSIQKEVHP